MILDRVATNISALRATWIPLAFLVGCGSKDTPAPACAPSALPAPPLPTLLATRDARIAVQARRWTDVVTGAPDPIEQEIALDKQVSWSERSRSLELTDRERDALIAAAALSAARPADPSRAFEGRYVTVSVQLPTGAPATLEMLRILDAARARYIASRIPEARTMTLELHGYWRGGSEGWSPWQLTVSPDGMMRELEQSTPLDDEDRIAVLDWASRLPERRTKPTCEHSSDPPPRGIDAFTAHGHAHDRSDVTSGGRRARARTRGRRQVLARRAGDLQRLEHQSRPGQMNASLRTASGLVHVAAVATRGNSCRRCHAWISTRRWAAWCARMTTTA